MDIHVYIPVSIKTIKIVPWCKIIDPGSLAIYLAEAGFERSLTAEELQIVQLLKLPVADSWVIGITAAGE